MKQILAFFSGILTVGLLILVSLPSVHATYQAPVRMKLIYGYDDMSWVETKDRIYISAYDEIVFDDMLMYRIGPKIYELDSLYETFIVEDVDTGEILYQKQGRDTITFDALYYLEDATLKFVSNDEEVVIESFTNFKMYFVKGTEYTKVNDNLVLIVNVDHPTELMELNSLFGAWDNYNGNITDSITVIEDNYSDNIHLTGFYTVTIEASDQSFNKKRFTYTVWVKDLEAPEVEPLEDIYVSYTNNLDIMSLLDQIVATDNYTDDLDISINDENYSGNEQTVGTYFIEYMIDDYNGNAITIRQNIHVIDDVPPVITGQFYHYLEVENFIRPNDMLSPMRATDAIDQSPIKVYLISTTYVKHTVGNFIAIVGAKDIYGNESTAEIIIEVKDSTAPEFFIKIPQINLNPSHVYSVEELLGLVESLLTFSYSEIEIVENNYAGNEHKPGVYLVTLSANTGFDKIRIQTQVRVAEPEIQTDIVNNTMAVDWMIITVVLTSFVAVIGTALVIINKRKKSIRLK